MDDELSNPLAPEDSSTLQGTVLAVQANYYSVRLDQPPSASGISAMPVSLLCTRRTRLKKIGQQVMVGDRVIVEEPDWEGGRGAISHVFPRRTELDRPPIANVDQILLVFSLAEPSLEPLQLSRFLVKAESTGLIIRLCLNKSDLVSSAEQQQWRKRLQQWGYEPLLISLRTHKGLKSVQAELTQKITVISGPSGVGKSSLINRLIPDVELRTGVVSGKLGRGRHTTRHVELFELPSGGLLADTPGFNQPDLHCLPTQLAHYFPEARQRLAENDCQFSNCLHRDEPNCAVRGEWERYDHYLTFLDEAVAYQTAIERTGDAESTLKVKTKGEGQLHSEPKLEAKKYRRPSRRTEKQVLRTLYRDLEELMTEGD
ncbi:MAG: small ribosomal subunit biogenesis GTPase RsgA [Synechococcales cyanobacterium M58_A2018_015]|nr:small ribosomal subunit biogenesis GTPase RsgA [Synechococcales cyanobacterium M58_A2018_015]